jgi:hypothetical protein
LYTQVVARAAEVPEMGEHAHERVVGCLERDVVELVTAALPAWSA